LKRLLTSTAKTAKAPLIAAAPTAQGIEIPNHQAAAKNPAAAAAAAIDKPKVTL
jgi:hypothetical protein